MTDDTSSGVPPSRRARPHGFRAEGKVVATHRIGSLLVASVIAVFGVLGFVGGIPFFSTSGQQQVVGLSSNGLLSVISLVTAAVLVFAAIRGGLFASTVMIVIGFLFLVSALVNLALLNTDLNFLAFRLPNVFFSIGAGLVLLLLGSYGRITGALPEDNPYRPMRKIPEVPVAGAENEAERRAARQLAAAERAVAEGFASPEQRAGVARAHSFRSQHDRLLAWLRRSSTT
ncbi:DUF4383 domain-containing protein [Saccharomonospora piscinae]|uniref:DUF4383 domain-containing protein n=1 Tax=Saccharomonospora piscinae TaxID=687388 RepID=UPI00055E83B6|nr:DUF4383 domain-containing protein [Saccharomonospora piscinae]